MDKSEIIKYGILAIFLVMFIGRALGTIIENMTSGIRKGKSPKGKNDIDRMIRQQEQMLRAQEGFVGESQNSKTVDKKNKSATISSYQLAFEKASASGDEAKKEDLKQILALFDNLQWGDGPIFGTLSKKVKEKYLVNIDSSIVLNHFRELIAKDLFISENKTYLYTDILETIIFKSILHKLCEEVKLRKGTALKRLADSSFTNTKCFSLAFEIFILRDRKVSDEEIFKKLSTVKDGSLLAGVSESEVIKAANHFLFNKEKKSLEKSKHFFAKVGKESQTVATIIPFKDLEHNDDLDGALEIFALPKNPSPEMVKKRYKELALSRHPDRLAGKNIPEGLKKQAHENFTTLQRAYDIIKSNT